MSIKCLSVDVWGGIHQYLQVHHTARLILTGDLVLQKLVTHCDRSAIAIRGCDDVTCSRARLSRSKLVTNVLLPHARNVKVNIEVFGNTPTSFRSVVDTTKINSLHLMATTQSHPTFDLSTLVNLVDFETDVRSAFVLPPGLTRLVVPARYDLVKAVPNFGTLVSLTSLDCALSLDNPITWPVGLTSMRISGLIADTSTADELEKSFVLLPDSLTDLSLSVEHELYRGTEFDIVPPRHLTRLTSLNLHVRCRMKTQTSFPRQLRRLHAKLVVYDPRGDKVYDALIRSRLEMFTLSGMGTYGDDGNLWHDMVVRCEWRRTLCAMASFLSVDGLHKLSSFFVTFGVHSLSASDENEVTNAMSEAFDRLGYGPRYFKFIFSWMAHRSLQAYEFASKCDDRHVREFLQSSNVVYYSPVDEADPVFDWYVSHNTLHRFDVFQAKYLRRIRDVSAIRNVVLRDSDGELSEVFGDDRIYRSLEHIKFIVDQPEKTVAFLVAHRNNFPALQRVTVSKDKTWNATIFSLMAQLGLYPDKPSEHWTDFHYRVCPLTMPSMTTAIMAS